MTSTQKRFGLDILEELNNGYDVIRLSRWAYSKYLLDCGDLEIGLKEKIKQVVVMEEGPEFEMNEEELRSFAMNLTTKRTFY